MTDNSNLVRVICTSCKAEGEDMYLATVVYYYQQGGVWKIAFHEPGCLFLAQWLEQKTLRELRA